MKINTSNIERYDVGDLDQIAVSVDAILGFCKGLLELSDAMRKNIIRVESFFTSVNMDRAKEVIEQYIKELTEANVEFDELYTSVRDFENKLRDAGSDWK